MQTTYGLLSPFHYGRGYQEVVSITSPAAGANLTHNLAGKWWSRLIACTFQLTTSSTTGNRFVTVQYANQGGTVYAADGPAIAVAPSATSQQFYGTTNRGSSEGTTGSANFFSLWGGFMPPSGRIVLNVAGIDTTDQLAAIVFTFERFEVGEEGYLIGGIDTQQYAQWAAEHYS